MPDYKLPPEAYGPGGLTILKAASFTEGLQEYSRLRKTAKNRIYSFKGTEFESNSYVQFQSRPTRFPAPSKVKTASQLQTLLGNVKAFLESSQSTPARMRALNTRRIETLHNRGYTFVTKENIAAFGRFMEAARLRAGGFVFGSPIWARMYEAAEKKGIDPMTLLKDFDYWKNNIDELEKSRPLRDGERVSADDYRERIERRKARERHR